MDQLYPIIRRVRRPLLPPDAVPSEVAVEAAEGKSQASPTAEQKLAAAESDAEDTEQ